MVLRTLGRTRARTTFSEQQDYPLSESGTSPQQSSTNPLDTSIFSPMEDGIDDVSPTRASKITKRGQKRHNNLFGSGRLRDDVHSRIVRGDSGYSALSDAGSDASTIPRTLRIKSNFLRPGSPEPDLSGISAPSSPNALADHESLSTYQTTFLDSSSNTPTGIRPSYTFQPDAFKHASLALKNDIREIEEEAEEVRADGIVLLPFPAADRWQRSVNNGDRLVCVSVLCLTTRHSIIPTQCTHRNRNENMTKKSSLLQRCPVTNI